MQTGQDFAFTAGDTELPIFTVTDASGAAIDISTVAAIVWTAQETIESAPLISKSLGSGVALVGGGATGKFSVTLAPSDSAGLAGYFLHQAKITDAFGNVSTVASGTVNIIRSTPAAP